MFKERFTRFRALMKFIEVSGMNVRIEYSDALLRRYNRRYPLSPYGAEFDASMRYLKNANQNIILTDSTLSRVIYQGTEKESYTLAQFSGTAWEVCNTDCSRKNALLWMLGLNKITVDHKEAA